ncbi:kinesin-related protein 4-like [Argiope bruennichi]|uniref:Uncharacterized protein n=1 Tax=Argiope bruennichi TaxID=94029 RepID=A0A8T0E3M6_ARGBR|nr:kinesin-related protein 4-like [Argiope bruennichi]KAF8764859.1 hypothetical protein HNY73_022899 [Argiope bruennichi]
MNSSSDFAISSDWDIIDDETSQLVDGTKKSEEGVPGDLKEKETMQKGSCVDDIPEQEDACVPEITGSEINNHHENSSSSEFDVLDESVEDSNQGNLSFSHMEYSISSSLESSHPSLVPEVEAVDADAETDVEIQADSHSSIFRIQYALNVHPYLVAFTLSLAFIAILLASAPLGTLKQMKERVNALQAENNELKNLVQSKLENDKLLMALEEQIRSLKDENFKLSESMKALVAQLEEQTAILRMDKETKVQDPFRSEIEKLKEQINILQIDNEELQKQLVRTRYGIYSPHPQEQKANPSSEEKETKDKPDNKENRENSSEILMEEINELRKKLYTEVEKLKSWKDSVQHLVKKLGNGYTGSSAEEDKPDLKDKESFAHSRSSSEKERMKKSKPGKKDRKFSDWSWRDVKENLKDTFEGLQDIDVPNMFSNYVVDKKKIEGVFESVGHYFKKAQEKTKKVLNFNNDINQEMWHFFGQLRNQWNDISNKYYQKYYSTKQAAPKTEDYKSQFQKHKEDAQDFGTDKRFDRYQKQNKPEETNNNEYDQNLYPDLESFTTSPTAETPDSEKNEMAPEDKAYDDNSWVFKRAAHRSQLREEEQEAFTNWFLKRGRDFHYNEDESLKEWFKETYQNGNSDED